MCRPALVCARTNADASDSDGSPEPGKRGRTRTHIVFKSYVRPRFIPWEIEALVALARLMGGYNPPREASLVQPACGGVGRAVRRDGGAVGAELLVERFPRVPARKRNGHHARG